MNLGAVHRQAKVTPSSLILRMAPQAEHRKPPGSVRIGPFHCMKSCRSPWRWITLGARAQPEMEGVAEDDLTPMSSMSRGNMPLHRAVGATGMKAGVSTTPRGEGQAAATGLPSVASSSKFMKLMDQSSVRWGADCG